MSKLIVDVCRLTEVRPHPNADRLEIAIVKGWQVVVPKGTYSSGDLVTYIPPDAILPEEFSNSIGVTKYLSNGRVRCAKLRGEPSFGIVSTAHGKEGEDVSAKLGITKYEPPIRLTAGDAERDDPLFVKYTEIENLRNFGNVFVEGEPVAYTEKIHGTNSRVGLIREENGEITRMAGSKGLRRKETAGGLYWYPWTIKGVESFLMGLAEVTNAKQIILFGEIYGKVQSLNYGLPNGIDFKAFDLMFDGKYVDFELFKSTCLNSGIPMVPILEEGPFSMAKTIHLSRGKSQVQGADNIREGVVVKPLQERHDPTTGRVILKYISDDYLCKNIEDTGE